MSDVPSLTRYLRTKPLDNVLVVQCQNCSTILSDSTQFVCSHSSLQTLTLKGASSVVIHDSRTEEVQSGPAASCVVHPIECSTCSARVGAQYRSTPAGLEVMRNMLSFDIASICSYELGLPEVRVNCGSPSARGPSAEASKEGEDRQRIAAVEMQLLKVENLLLLYHERLEALEKGAPFGATTTRAAGGPPASGLPSPGGGPPEDCSPAPAQHQLQPHHAYRRTHPPPPPTAQQQTWARHPIGGGLEAAGRSSALIEQRHNRTPELAPGHYLPHDHPNLRPYQAAHTSGWPGLHSSPQAEHPGHRARRSSQGSEQRHQEGGAGEEGGQERGLSAGSLGIPAGHHGTQHGASALNDGPASERAVPHHASALSPQGEEARQLPDRGPASQTTLVPSGNHSAASVPGSTGNRQHVRGRANNNLSHEGPLDRSKRARR